MTTYAISHKKLTRTIRLELDAIWLETEVSKKFPPFKFDGIDKFECKVECRTHCYNRHSWTNVADDHYTSAVSISVEADVVNPARRNRETFKGYLSYKFIAEAADGKEVHMGSNSRIFTTAAILRSNNCVVNDKVEFVITVSYIVPRFFTNTVRKCKAQFQPFELMRRDPDTCDVQFVVVGEGTPVLAHRAFLSLISPVFAAMFAHNTKEAQTGIIIITDFDYATVKAAVDILYGHPFEPKSNMAIEHVSRFAGKYIIDAVVNGLDELEAVEHTNPDPARGTKPPNPGHNGEHTNLDPGQSVVSPLCWKWFNLLLFCLLPAFAIVVLLPLFRLMFP
uniref:BTB domain-containing protein n=1 Tax=Panagrellus redivivus TaxID=6233 RepID=A0A7E4W931_PANRE